jgi:hypothetical protein
VNDAFCETQGGDALSVCFNTIVSWDGHVLLAAACRIMQYVRGRIALMMTVLLILAICLVSIAHE